jgi:hypothetical protein
MSVLIATGRGRCHRRNTRIEHVAIGTVIDLEIGIATTIETNRETGTETARRTGTETGITIGPDGTGLVTERGLS